jgi:signal transduction histidine kinase
VLYVALTVTFDVIDANHLLAQVDAHLSEQLTDASHRGDLSAQPDGVADNRDIEAAPIVLWRVGSPGHTVTLSDGAPALSTAAWSRDGQPTTANLGRISFRLLAIRASGGWLVAGQSLADTKHVESVLAAAEIIAGPILVIAIFLGALVIGLKASDPVEQARRRQLEFTADASHELRTPLSVIEAEVNLALGTSHRAPRQDDASRYHDTLERVGRESARLRRIVEDLLWLARSDSEPPPPGHEPVDLTTIAEGCADRFSGIARAKDIALSVRSEGDEHAWINAPPEWVDRLTGVLVDNACRYAGPAGTVRIQVAAIGNRVSLSVSDSGPGIPPAEQPRLFDRFHRATDEGTGAGLGLAIADEVVRSTGGRWRVGDAPEGGAHLEVSWHRAHPRGTDRSPGKASREIARGTTANASARPDDADRSRAHQDHRTSLVAGLGASLSNGLLRGEGL